MARLTGFIVTKGFLVIAGVDSIEAAKAVIVEDVMKEVNDDLEDIEAGQYCRIECEYRIQKLP